MEIRPIQTKEAWNTFVLSCTPNTFLHSWQWKEVQEIDSEQVDTLGFYTGEELVAVALVIFVKAKRGNHYLIPHGPILKDAKDMAKVLQALIVRKSGGQARGSAVCLRIAPLLENISENREMFSSLGFRPSPMHVHAELTWVLDITKPEEVLLQEMRKTTRNAIAKAQKEGVKVEISSSPVALERFWPLYEQTKTRHHFIPFQKDFIASQAELFGASDSMFFAIATYQHKDVAAAMLIQFGDTVFYYHGASAKTQIPATQLLQWEAIREAKKRGATNYNFWGIAPERSEGVPRSLWRSGAHVHPFAGITVFKKGFGGYAIDYMHAQDLSLSWKYWKLWAIEMWRKKKRGF